METKCPMCGAPMENEGCGYCGYVANKQPEPTAYTNDVSQQLQTVQQMSMNPQPINNMGVMPGISRKSKVTALLLCIFLGWAGAHRFYVGKIGTGILYLFTIGICGIGWLVDIIFIAMGSFEDDFGLPLRQ